MSTNETGGPAFPAGAVRKGRERPHDAGSDWVVTERIDPAQGGMTLRDYFAAKAMQATIKSAVSVCGMQSEYDRLADHSYRMADAMLEARKS